MDKTRAVVYTRVSTDKVEQETSLQFQQEYYSNFCEREGYQLIHIFADEGLTGTNSKRDDFLKMMHGAGLNFTKGSGKIIHFDKSDREPLFDLIIVKDVSRFSRNIDTMSAVRLLREKGVYILFENNNLITSQEDYSFRLSLYLTFAENESQDKSKKMKWSLKHKAQQKQFHFSRLPYGFERKDDGSYILNQQEAAVICEMYDMYINQNKGFSLIAHHLNDRKIPNKQGKIGKWSSEAINRIISSERNHGTVVLQRISNGDITGSASRVKNDEDKWVKIENALPQIIDKQTWKKAMKIKNNRSQVLSDNTKTGKRMSKDIFAKKIVCTKCGSRFVRVTSNKMRAGKKVRETTYFCYNRRKHKSCDMRGISFNVLERELFRAIKGVKDKYKSASTDDELEMAQQIFDTLDEKEKNADEIIKGLKSKIEKIDSETEEISNAFIKANERMAQILNKKIDQLEEEKQHLNNKILSYDITAILKKRQIVTKRYDDIVKAGKMEYKTLPEILDVVDRIEIKENKQFDIFFKLETLFDIYLVEVKMDGDMLEYLEKDNTTKTLQWDVKY